MICDLSLISDTIVPADFKFPHLSEFATKREPTMTSDSIFGRMFNNRKLFRNWNKNSRRSHRAKLAQDKFRKELELDYLENREMLAVDVVVGDLLFRGDLVQEAELYRATAKPIQIGFNPTQGEAFRSLVTMTGDMKIDREAGLFSIIGKGEFIGSSNPIAFWQSDTNDNFSVSDLTGNGIRIVGPMFEFGGVKTKATLLKLTNPGGGDTSDTNVNLNGTGEFSFGTMTDGTKTDNPLIFQSYNLTVTGVDSGLATAGRATGTFYAAASKWQITGESTSARFEGGNNSIVIKGTARTTIRNETINTDLIDNNGLRITNGVIGSLEASVTEQTIKVAGTPLLIDGKLSWNNDNLKFTGKAKHEGDGFGLLTYDTMSFTVKQDVLTDLEGDSSLPFILQSGVLLFLPIKGLVGVSTKLNSKFGIDSNKKEYLAITGQASFSWVNVSKINSATLTITAAGNGFVIRDGILQDWDIQADGRLFLANKGIEARAVRIWYSTNDPKYGPNTVGIAGKLYMTLGEGREFKEKTTPSNPSDNIVASEPSNFIEIDCGTKQAPGLIIANGELRRIAGAVSFKEVKDRDKSFSKSTDTLKYKGMRLRVLGAGISWERGEDSSRMDWGFFGTIALDLGFGENNNSGFNLGEISMSLGTLEKPGLFIRGVYDENGRITEESDFKVQDMLLRVTNFKVNGWGINNFELFYKIPDLSKPNIAYWGGRFELAFLRDFYVGASLRFKEVDGNVQLDKVTVSAGIDPTGSTDGIPLDAIGLPGCFLIRLEAGIDNWTDPERWAIIGEATFGIGKRIEYWDTDTNPKEPQTRKAYPTVIRGFVSIEPALLRISGRIDVFVGAYWDKLAFSTGSEGWKPLIGKGKGTFLFDIGNNNYVIDFNADMIQLVTGRFQFRLNSTGFVLYAMVQAKPTPYGIWDFWPVNLIDASAHFLLLKTTDKFEVGAWARLKILAWDATIGIYWDILNGEAGLVGEEKANAMLQSKDNFFNGTSNSFPYSTTLKVSIDQNTAARESSHMKITIPFVSSTVVMYSNQEILAKPVTKPEDIEIMVPDLVGLTDLSHAYRIEFDTQQSTLVAGISQSVSYLAGTIILDVYANADKRTDYQKTFKSLKSLEKLSSFEIKINSKQRSIFFDAGTDRVEYIKQLNYDAGLYQNITQDNWDLSKKVKLSSTNGNKPVEYPLSPTAIVLPDIAPPVVSLKDNQLVQQSLNSYTNVTEIKVNANHSKITKNEGTVSLLVINETEMLENRWVVMQTGPWLSAPAGSGVTDSFVAQGYVVEKNSFDSFEKINKRANTPYSVNRDLTGMEVIFFNELGTIENGQVVSQLASDNHILIRSEAGVEHDLTIDKIKPLWVQKAPVMLSNNGTPGRGIWQVFTASNVPTGYSENNTKGGRTYFELFNTHSVVTNGNFSLESASILSPDWFKLPTLPNFVVNSKKYSSNPNDQFYRIDDSTGLKTMPSGLPLQLLGLNENNFAAQDNKASITPFSILTFGPDNTTTISMIWSEGALTPTPQFAYVLVNDGINSPEYSSFYKFEPSLAVQGRVMVNQGDNSRTPLRGAIVYFDTNGNGQYDSSEPFSDANQNGIFDSGDTFSDLNNNGIRDTYEEKHTFTNTNGSYYFYDVASGNHKLGFVLPQNKSPISGSTLIDVNHLSGGLTVVPDFVIQNLYPTLTGQVIVDLNGNGIRDNGELGVEGSYVLVTGANGYQTMTLTDHEGNYSIPIFDPAFGSSVTVSLPGNGRDPNLRISSTDQSHSSFRIDGIDYLKPKVFNTDFHVQSVYDFNYDSNLSIFENIYNYFQLFLDGRYSGISFRVSGFEFYVDRFKLLPFDMDRLGLESATGRVVIGGQTLNFALNGPDGMVTNGPKLQSLNLSLSGDFNIFGARLKLDNLNISYTAADEQMGYPARFSLSGSTTLVIDGNYVSVNLPGEGLVLSNGGVESLNIKLLGGLKIAGETIDLGSLTALYSKAEDKLTLTGTTTLLTFGSEAEGNYFGLQDVVMQIGKVSGLEQARILSLQAKVAGGLSFNGVSFEVDKLIVGYSPEDDRLNITGSSQLNVAGNILGVTLPSPGIQVGAGKVTILARATGELNISDFKFNLDTALVSYKDQSLRFGIEGSFYQVNTKLVMVGGEIGFKAGALSLINGKVSATIPMEGVSLDLQQLQASYDFENQLFNMQGAFQLSFIEKDLKSRVIRVAGSIGLDKGVVRKLTGEVESGDWTPFEGFTVNLQSLKLVYDEQDSTYGLSGTVNATLLGNTVGLSIVSPGLVWKNGGFSSFGGGISGSIPLQRDAKNKVVSEIYGKTLGFLFEADGLRLTMHGSVGLKFEDMVSGSLNTDSNGIVIDGNGLQRFSLFGSAGLNFGESFADTNGDFIRQSNETYTDSNKNGVYDFGFGINVSQLGLSFTPANGSVPSEILLSGKGSLGFGPEVFGEANFVSAIVDMTNPGIRIVEGKIKDFSFGLEGRLGLKQLSFDIASGCGVRWVSADERLDLWGNMGVGIEGVNFGVVAGTSSSPGFSLQKGDYRLNAGINGRVKLDSVEFTLKEAGILFDTISDEWGVYGSLRVNLGVWVEAALGSQSQPGFRIDTSDPNNINWSISQLTLGFGGLSLSGVSIREVKFKFAEVNNVISVEASCGVQFQGWGLDGRFAFRDGVISQIYVQANTDINIPSTPIFITRFAGSIENIDFNNLSKLTFTAMVGISIGPKIDLGSVPILSGQYRMAQFNGRAIVSPGGMRIQADGYLLAKEEGPIGKSEWKGYLGRGTAGVTINWAEHQYFADVDMALNTGGFGINPLFEARFRGRMHLDAKEIGFTINASATLQIARDLPFVGGREIAGASFLLEVYPQKNVIDVTSWFSYPSIEWDWEKSGFKEKKIGLQWDLSQGRWNVLDDGQMQSRLNRQIRPASLQLFADQPKAKSILNAAALPLQTASTRLISAAAVKGGFAYSGTSSPVPETDVAEGLYTVSFKVADVKARRNVQAWLGKVALKVAPVAGVRTESVAPIFDATTGLGTIAIRLLPLNGQYLPRGLVFNAQLFSPIAMKDPQIVASWTNAFDYSGALPPIGADPQIGIPTVGLNVTKANFSVEFKPIVAPGQTLPGDWLESLRVYLQPMPGVDFILGLPVFDSSTNTGRIEVIATPAKGTRFLPAGAIIQGTLRSKVALGGLNDLVSPDVSASWAGLPSEVDRPDVPAIIDNNPRVVRLTGRVNDPRHRQVSVSLYHSETESYGDGAIVSMANGKMASGVPIDVQPDGTWSVDINWDPSTLPSGKMWIYGVVDDNGPYDPVYGEAVDFTLRHDIEGIVRVPVPLSNNKSANDGSIFARQPAITAPESGVRVFADLNDNGLEDANEPVAITDQSGHYSLDIPGEGRPIAVIVDTPVGFAMAPGQSARQVVDITRGPGQFNVNLVPTSTILTGRVVVATNQGQSVGGIGVLAKGPDGRVYRETTDIFGEFRIPVSGPGPFTFDLDRLRNNFYNYTISPLPGWTPMVVYADATNPCIIDLAEIAVNSTGQVQSQADFALSTLTTLISQANQGYVNQIDFSDSMAGKSFTLKGELPPLNHAYTVWDQQNQSWKGYPASAPIGPDGQPDDSNEYGPTAFVIQQNLNIDGGNLGITLEGDGSSRAFLVRRGVAFGLANLSVKGFGATGTNGAPGISGMAGSALGAEGGGAGLGGAILNMGTTMVNNVDFISNKATGGKGGSIPVAATGLSMVENGISNNGSGGQFGGQGGKAYPVTLTYTRAGDTTARTTTVEIPGAGGGGSGLGGAIFNANAESVLKIQGNTRFISNQVIDGQGGTSPDYLTNLASAILGDDAITLTVSGFNESSLSRAQNGKALGAAIFNNGGVVQFDGLPGTDLEAPARMTLTNSRIAENNAPGAVVGSFLAGSQPADEGTVYSLVEGSGSDGNSAFAIVNQQLLAIRSLNCELKNRYSIRVRATGNNGLYTEKTFTISVVDRVESLRPLLNLPKSFVVQGDKTSALVLPDTPFSDLVARSSQIFTVTLRVRAGSLAASLTSDVAVSGTPTNLSFKGTLSALNSYFTAPEGRVRYTPLALSRQSRLIQFRLSKSIGLNTYSTTSQARININSDRIPAQLQMTTNSLSRPGSLIPKGQ